MTAHTGDAIFQAILDEPENLDHRLVYADWLEENGTTELDAARAELIRVQIGREAADPDGEDYWSLRARERILLTIHGDALSAGVRDHVPDHRFRRGFVEAASLEIDALVRAGTLLRAAAPLQAVALAGAAERLTPVAIAHFHGLRLWSVLWLVENPEAQRRLAGAVQARLLDLSPAWWDFLVAVLERGLPLEHLGLGSGGLPATDGRLPTVEHFDELQVEQLRATPMPPTLRSLDLRGVRIDLAPMRAFLAAPWMRQIERLYLWNETSDGQDILGPIAVEPNLAGLRSLWIGGPFPEGTGWPGASLRSLRHLVLQGAFGLNGGRSTFLADLQMAELETFRVEYLDDASALVDLLRRARKLWPNLRVLEFHRWQRNYHAELPQLLASPCMESLRRLELPGLPDTGLPRDFGPLPLAELTLTAHDIGTALGAIAHSPVLANLVALEIARARLYTPKDLEPLLDRARFPRLLRLHVGGLDLDATWRRRFAERFGPGAIFSAEPVRTFAIHDRILEGWL